VLEHGCPHDAGEELVCHGVEEGSELTVALDPLLVADASYCSISVVDNFVEHHQEGGHGLLSREETLYDRNYQQGAHGGDDVGSHRLHVAVPGSDGPEQLVHCFALGVLVEVHLGLRDHVCQLLRDEADVQACFLKHWYFGLVLVLFLRHFIK